MRVGQQHRVDGFRSNRKGSTVALAQLLVALEETAIDQDSLSSRFDQVARARDRAGGAQELQRWIRITFHGYLPGSSSAPSL